MSIKAIHTLKTKLRMSDADYRALLMNTAGVSSSKDLTPEGDKAVMAALRELESGPRHIGATTRAEAKIWALWYAVKPYLPEPERTVPYLLGICGRVTGYRIPGTDTLPRLSGQEKYKIIEALKKRLKQEEFLYSQKTGVPF